MKSIDKSQIFIYSISFLYSVTDQLISRGYMATVDNIADAIKNQNLTIDIEELIKKFKIPPEYIEEVISLSLSILNISNKYFVFMENQKKKEMENEKKNKTFGFKEAMGKNSDYPESFGCGTIKKTT